MEPAQFSVIETVRKSLKLAWEHKILWVFALVLAGGVGSGLGSSGSSSSDSTSTTDYKQETFFDFDEIPIPTDASEAVTVLGLNSLAQASPFGETETAGSENSFRPLEPDEIMTPEEMLKQFEAETGETLPPGFIDLIYESTKSEGGLEGLPPYGEEFPPFNPDSGSQFPFDPAILNQFTTAGQRAVPNLILVGIVFVFAMLFYMAIWLIVNSWAQGAILTGVDDAIKGDEYTLRKLGTHGRISARELVKYKVLIFALLFVSILIFTVIGVVSGTVQNEAASGLASLLLILFIIVLLVFFLVVTYGSFFATRFIVLKQYKSIDAFKQGIKTFKDNFVKSCLMSCANCLVIVVLIIAIFVVLGIVMAILLGVGGVFGQSDSIGTAVVIILSILAIPVGIAFLLGFLVVRAYMTTYQQFTWSFLFNFATRSDKTETKKVIEVEKEDSTEQSAEGLEPEGGSDGK